MSRRTQVNSASDIETAWTGIVEKSKLVEYKEGGPWKTAEDFAKETGDTPYSAARVLNKLARDGVLLKDKAIVRGVKVDVFCPR